MKGSFGVFLVKGLTESATGKDHTRGSDVVRIEKMQRLQERGKQELARMKTVERCRERKRIEGAPAWGKKERKKREVVVAGKGIIYSSRLYGVHYGKTSTDSE